MQEEKVQRLSEGYDFIEEAVSMTSEPLCYQSANEVMISESESTKSPYRILGKLKGCFAPVGGFSRNNRYYPPSHWVNILKSPEIQRRLAGREMFGMISHEDAKVGDVQIKEGLVSHIVTVLDIREDANGKPYLYGEMEILDTPAGRILKAMHEGGAGLYVSSRGAGKLLDTPGQTYKTVSPQFYLECFDVVSRAGFVEAKPVFEQVKESTNESVNEAQVSEENAECEFRKSEFDKAFDKYTQVKKETGDHQVSNPETKKAYDEAMKAKKNLDKAREQASESELESLKSQLNKLAAVVEKVVDDVYEVPNKEDINKQIAESEQFADFLKLMSETDVSEDVLSDIFHMIFNKEEK